MTGSNNTNRFFETHGTVCIAYYLFHEQQPYLLSYYRNFFYYINIFFFITPAICRQRISFYQLLFPVTCKIYQRYHKENKKNIPKQQNALGYFCFFTFGQNTFCRLSISSNINIKELIANLRFKNNRFGIGKITACHNIE